MLTTKMSFAMSLKVQIFNIFSFRMLQVNIGETVYPTFTVSRVTQIFKDRDSVLRYKYTHTGIFVCIFFKNCTSQIRFSFLFRFSEACLLEADLWSKLERNDFGAAYQVYLEAQERVLELKKDKDLSRYMQFIIKNCNLETRVSDILLKCKKYSLHIFYQVTFICTCNRPK